MFSFSKTRFKRVPVIQINTRGPPNLKAPIVKRARFENRIQMIMPSMRLRPHQLVLREIKGISAKFSFQKSVFGTPAILESVLGKSSVIPV